MQLIGRQETLLSLFPGEAMAKLTRAVTVAIDKSFSGRKPLTRVRLTDQGRAAFVAYLAAIEKLLPQADAPGR